MGPVIKEKLSMLPGMKPNRVNETIKMECAKVVDTVDIEDMGDKGVFCRYRFRKLHDQIYIVHVTVIRCWKSKKFPYCDGSHAKHNTETGDNVGPLIVKKSS